MTCAGKDPIFQPEEFSLRDKREPRQFPEGVFGQKYPQNITTREGYPSVEALGVKPEAQHKDADKVGLDGLPHVGAVVWPSESYYSTVDRMTCKCSACLVSRQVSCCTLLRLSGHTSLVLFKTQFRHKLLLQRSDFRNP